MSVSRRAAISACAWQRILPRLCAWAAADMKDVTLKPAPPQYRRRLTRELVLGTLLASQDTELTQIHSVMGCACGHRCGSRVERVRELGSLVSSLVPTKIFFIRRLPRRGASCSRPRPSRPSASSAPRQRRLRRRGREALGMARPCRQNLRVCPEFAQPPSHILSKERKRTTQGRDGRTARRHHTGILRRGVWCASRRPPLGVRLFLSLFAVSLRFSLQPSCHISCLRA